ncbi:MAG TPA: heparan-alpha-glucosaminide N-acetyltransferase domain-containing protein [Bryobacteraceae bacterium]|nr:heparan-alpha-glucosaminide N-acetyltransferase domain-containing protein [Bryobacteraceae bacterium]
MAANNNPDGRLTFLDWTRGFVVVTMLNGHVFHSFTQPALRNDGPYTLSQFIGGEGPAVFLLLTGITLAFLLHGRERKGLGAWDRWKAALRRSGYLWLLALAFRVQLWAFGFGQSSWKDLFKVDVLNCMGFGIAVMSIMAVFSTAERARLCAVLGVLIAGAAPVVSSMNWTWLPPEVYNYFVPNLNYFGFFPWAAFIAFGISFGSILRLTPPDQMNRLMQWSALGGLAIVFAAQFFSNLPNSIYPSADFWLNSPGLTFIKAGVFLLMVSFAYLWCEYAVGSSFSWVRQLGTTSLIVYWVHIELVYGRWFGSWKESLNNWQCALFVAILIPAMLLLSLARTKLRGVRWSDWFAPYAGLNNARRVSGD